MIRLGNGLLPLNALAWLLVAIIFFLPSNLFRIIIGIPFIVFFPGYALTTALFPRRNQSGDLQRLLLSFGLSIIVVPLVGLMLNYTPWGISLDTVPLSTAIFILAASVVAWYRYRRLNEQERFTIAFNLSLAPWKAQGQANKFLSVILILVIVGSMVTLGYAIAAPKTGETFTEFYILGLEGKAIRYPRELKVGEEGSVIVGIINREHESMSYRVEVRTDGVSNNQIGPLELAHDEKWQEIVSFIPDRAGDNQKVEFLLYKSGESEAYRELHLWVDVK